MCGRRRSAHSAGDSVKALIIEKKTETDMVIANCWNSRAEIPPEKEMGIKTANNTRVVAIIGEVTLRIASAVASFADSPRSMPACEASTTTIASSTTKPTDSTRPKREMIFIVKPNIGNRVKVPMRDTGIAISGISVARQLCKKM